MSPSIFLDLETRSVVDLRKAGVYVYAESPTTDLWCACFALDDGPIELWTPDQPCPPLIAEAVEKGWLFRAWNANFERTIWRHVIAPRYSWPEPKLENWRCDMAAALASSLPGALENAAPALDVPGKDMAGKALMLRMGRPRRVDPDGLVWWDEPEKIQRLCAYCATDVEVERAVSKRLVPLSDKEQRLWELDQRINDLGAYVDRDLCYAAKKIVAAAADKLNREMVEITKSAVTACSNVGQLTAYCREHGLEVDSLAKDKLAGFLARDDLPVEVRRPLELRQEAAKASVAKIDTLLAGCSSDGRARGMFQFHAASTGRWAGRRFQPQNIVRSSDDANQMIEDVLRGDVELLEVLWGPPLHTVSNCLRGMVCAAPGNRLIAADFASIESRVITWLAGEDWKLDAFRAFDAGTGPDLYKLAYAKSFGIDSNQVDKHQRQIGKTMELALAYGGGAGAFATMARGLGVEIADSYGFLAENTPAAAWERAVRAYDDRGVRSGMDRRSWLAAEIVKLVWREAHPRIVALWKDLERGALESLDNPGKPVVCGKLKFITSGSFLFMSLPSGRVLTYPYPRRVMRELPWDGPDGEPAKGSVLAHKGTNSVTRLWEDTYAYGGLWSENATQAAARDILAEAMPRLEGAGYPIVLTSHDEAVAEVPEHFGTVEAFVSLMTHSPEWACGLPIAAEGWIGTRYRK